MLNVIIITLALSFISFWGAFTISTFLEGDRYLAWVSLLAILGYIPILILSIFATQT